MDCCYYTWVQLKPKIDLCFVIAKQMKEKKEKKVIEIHCWEQAGRHEHVLQSLECYVVQKTEL